MPRTVPNKIERLDEFPSYMGGHTSIVNGYIFEFVPHHWLANGWGWVAQHRLIGEVLVGRRLCQSPDWDEGEVVHHVDENRLNNAPSNLMVLTKRAHSTLHAIDRAIRQKARLTEEAVSSALIGRTLKEAGKLLGCDHNTLRNRFPHLVEAKLRARPNRAEYVETLERIRPYAVDSTKSVADCSQNLHMSERTIVKCCRLHGLEWVDKHRPGRPPKSTRHSSG